MKPSNPLGPPMMLGNMREARGRGKRRQDVHWAAVLAEARRIDGQPKQQHVAYLGGITKSAMRLFISVAGSGTPRLDQLGSRISAADRRRIVPAVAKRVPRPTKAERAQCVRDREALGLITP